MDGCDLVLRANRLLRVLTVLRDEVRKAATCSFQAFLPFLLGPGRVGVGAGVHVFSFRLALHVLCISGAASCPAGACCAHTGESLAQLLLLVLIGLLLPTKLLPHLLDLALGEGEGASLAASPRAAGWRCRSGTARGLEVSFGVAASALVPPGEVRWEATDVAIPPWLLRASRTSFPPSTSAFTTLTTTAARSLPAGNAIWHREAVRAICTLRRVVGLEKAPSGRHPEPGSRFPALAPGAAVPRWFTSTLRRGVSPRPGNAGAAGDADWTKTRWMKGGARARRRRR